MKIDTQEPMFIFAMITVVFGSILLGVWLGSYSRTVTTPQGTEEVDARYKDGWVDGFVFGIKWAALETQDVTVAESKGTQ